MRPLLKKSPRLSSAELALKCSKIRSITDRSKLPWLYEGSWKDIFKKVDTLLSNLTTYHTNIDDKARAMRRTREQQNTMDTNKFSRDITILKINLSTYKFKEFVNGYLLRRRLKAIDPWEIVKISDSLIVSNYFSKSKQQLYDMRRTFWSKIKDLENTLYLDKVTGFIAKHVTCPSNSFLAFAWRTNK